MFFVLVGNRNILSRKKKKESREHKAANGMVVIAQADALRGAAVPMADEEGDTTSTESRAGIQAFFYKDRIASTPPN